MFQITSGITVGIHTDSPCYWIGLERRSGRRELKWKDGSTFAGFLGEIPVEKDFYRSDKKCVCIANQSGNAIIKAKGCNNLAPYMCQRAGTETLRLVSIFVF